MRKSKEILKKINLVLDEIMQLDQEIIWTNDDGINEYTLEGLELWRDVLKDFLVKVKQRKDGREEV